MKTKVKLSSAIKLLGGGTPKTTNIEYWNGNIPWLSVADFNTGNKYVYKTEKYITQKGLNESSTQILQEGSIIISARGTVGALAVLKKPMAFNQSCYGIYGIDGISISDYIYYILRYNLSELQQISHGGVFSTITRDTFENIEIFLPSIVEQRAIAAVLSSLDDKIDLLHRQNATLEAMAEALFRQWFVVEAKEEWEEKKLGDFFPVKTGKKDANYSIENGQFPFFTCSKKMLFAPSYSFDGAAILLAGNGDFNVKRYIGKFEAYQRTYVLIPNDIKFFNFLYIAIKIFLNDLTGGYRGSVINFITKGMIENFPLFIPKKAFDDKLKQFEIIFAKVDANVLQINTLEKLRDTLLPKLMSGEVRIDF